jgi:hypothetical protein
VIQPPPTNCPDGYTPYGENCFIIEELNSGEANWAGAQARCQRIGDKHGNIATVVDIFENAEMRVLINHMIRKKGLNTGTAWIGMQEHRGSYTWHNACPVTYSNFRNLFAKPEKDLSCVRMTAEGMWEAANCDGTADYAVCERRTGKEEQFRLPSEFI